MSSYKILIAGKELSRQSAAAAQSVIEVTVLQDISTLGMFAVRMDNWDESHRKGTWSDLFKLGSKVEILLPGRKDLVSVMEGEITGLEPEFPSGGPMTVTVRGYDRRHRLMRGTKTYAWPLEKESQIARQLADAVGLKPAIEDTKDTLDYVMQHNQTDLEFLQRRAGRLGFEMKVEGGRLMFREHREGMPPVLTLNRNDLEEFYPRLSTIGLACEVVVQGWSANDKKVIMGKASAGDLKAMGEKSGLAAADEAFKAARAPQVVIVDQPVQSEAEARQIALGRLREMALTYMTGEGVAIGCADLKAGTVVRIAGYGKRFNGHYYLTSVRHTYSSNGYRTAFTVQRNAS